MTEDKVNFMVRGHYRSESDGTPHVSYYVGGTSKDAYYATRSTSGGWTNQAIETTNEVGSVSAIAVSRDSIHVAFYDFTNKDLRYATKVIDGSTWRSAPARSATKSA